MGRRLFALFFITSMLFTACQAQVPQSQLIESLLYNAPTQEVITNFEKDEVTIFDDYEYIYYPYDAGFTGLEVDDVTHEYGNNVFSNLTSNRSVAHGLCYAKEIDTLFYVDFKFSLDPSESSFLYAYKEGSSSLVLEESVNCPIYWKGDLYFLSNDNTVDLYDQGTSSHGKLYRYNLKTKTKELLLDDYIWDLSLCDGYFYFRNSVTIEQRNNGLFSAYYRMPLEGGTPEETNYRPFFYGDYQLQIDPHPSIPGLVALELTNGMDTKRVLNYGYYSVSQSEYCIDDGVLWFRYDDEEAKEHYASMDLSNGEVTTYRFEWKEGLQIRHPLNDMNNFTVLNGNLYVNYGGRFAFYDPQQDALIPIPVYLVDVLQGDYNSMSRIYTDGTSLYAYDTFYRSVQKITPNGDGTNTEELIQP